MTHQLIDNGDHITALGYGSYFSWDIIIEYNEFVLYSIFGAYHGKFSTFKKVLDYIGWKE